ncbi:MAG: CoA-binding protein [Candidatus Rokubacteria bacterium]|nr:CoA-binding protein [Candidatus Rokubacteria bacterium]
MRNLRRSDVKVRRLLDGARTIAVIGASRRRSDRSWTAVDYLRRNGFDVVPVRDDRRRCPACRSLVK